MRKFRRVLKVVKFLEVLLALLMGFFGSQIFQGFWRGGVPSCCALFWDREPDAIRGIHHPGASSHTLSTVFFAVWGVGMRF